MLTVVPQPKGFKYTFSFFVASKSLARAYTYVGRQLQQCTRRLGTMYGTYLTGGLRAGNRVSSWGSCAFVVVVAVVLGVSFFLNSGVSQVFGCALPLHDRLLGPHDDARGRGAIRRRWLVDEWQHTYDCTGIFCLHIK